MNTNSAPQVDTSCTHCGARSLSEDGTHPGGLCDACAVAATTPTPAHAVGIPNGTVSFRATLTATTNNYLADRLPLTGLVQIGERDVNGNPMPHSLVFMPDPKPGERTSFVSIPDAELTFGTRQIEAIA